MQPSRRPHYGRRAWQQPAIPMTEQARSSIRLAYAAFIDEQVAKFGCTIHQAILACRTLDREPTE